MRTNGGPTRGPDVDAEGLARELGRRVRGEVRFDPGSRALYATDASNYRQIPIGVVLPRDAEDVERTVEVCRRYGAPILARGGGTSLAGQCCNVAVVLDTSKYMNHIVELDPAGRRARVEPGIVLDRLREAAEEHGLTFGPDPATHDHCTIGGMVGNNSCGVHSMMAGRTADNVEELEILTYGGERLRVGATSDEELERILRSGGRRGGIYDGLRSLRDRYAGEIRRVYPHIPRRVSGYNLDELLPESGFQVARALVGTECTCVLVLEATLKLVPSPSKRVLLVLGYPSVYDAGDHIPEIRQSGPIGLEGLDDFLVSDMKKKGLHPDDVALLPGGKGWLLVEFGSDSEDESRARARGLMDRLHRGPSPPTMKLLDQPGQAERIWKVRESGLGATARVPGERDTWPGWEDSAVPPDRVGEYLRRLRELFRRFGYEGALYGHFGQGCIHTRINFDLVTKNGIETYRRFVGEAADLVVGLGGSLSGEHGDGESRAELLPKMFGPHLVEAFREFKHIWDPDGRMNPGKVVDPYPITGNLRLGSDYDPRQPRTHFQYPDDDGSFARATTRCVGVGKCRREHGGTMCPSYRVTHEEEHSTRGRAHLLFEMLHGGPVEKGWRDPHVREALDLCLACKGCKGDCPVSVDVATYKAEFLSHYYDKRLRPRSAYALGWIYWVARAAAHAPWLANFATQTPLLRSVAKAAAGIAPQRRIPRFASRSFRSAFRRRHRRGLEPAGPDVILWPDTFNNHFFPEVQTAAVRALERAGSRVRIPNTILCCGRPLYDYGMLDLARKLLRQILEVLGPDLEAGVPVVVLEPSCLAVFRDELVNLFPSDLQAMRLKRQSFTLGEYLVQHAPREGYPELRRKALVHGHCHQKALFGLGGETELFHRMGLDARILDTGCCGMAGSFGFERAHCDVSTAVGENDLIPKVREAGPETILVADGFSCREQIAQMTDRRALHTAQVFAMALETGPDGPVDERPEQHPATRRRSP